MRCSLILNYYHVTYNINCLQLFVLMHTDDSYGISNLYAAWRKAVRKLWRLPYTTHCNLLHTFNNSLPIEISLEKRSVKSIWSCVNSENDVIKTISRLSRKLPRSFFCQNYRYFSYKYSILPHQWYESYNSVPHSIMDYISQNCTDHNYGIMIRDLCFLQRFM